MQVEAEIEAFGGVDDVSVVLSDSNTGSTTDFRSYTVTFDGPAVAGHVDQLTLIDVGANGCSEVDSIADLTMTEEILVDSFVPLYKVQNTADLAYDATAADVKAAIETLTGACTVDVTRSVMGNGYEWLVTFLGAGDNSTDQLLRTMRPNALLLDNTAEYVEPEAVIVPILRAELSTPQSGVPYYVRAAAINAVGTGGFRTSSPTSLQPAAQPPAAPTFARVKPLSDTELVVQWEAPLSDGGEAISEYVLEWDTATTFDSGADGNPLGSALVNASELVSVADVQAVRVSVDNDLSDNDQFLAGSFFLEYNGQRTGSIPFDASAAEVENALEALCTIGDVTVSRSLGPASGGHTWLVTMIAAAEGGEAGDGGVETSSTLQTISSHKLHVDGQNLLFCSDAGRLACSSDASITSVALQTQQEKQRLHCDTAAGLTITFMGETTATISSGAAAPDIEAALEAFYNIGDVTVTLYGSDDQTVTGACAADTFVEVAFENDSGDLPVLSSTEKGDFEEVAKGSAQVVVGQKPFSYVISDITTTQWTVRVSAYNRVGYGDYAVATHDSSEMVAVGVGAPAMPESINVDVESARSAWVYWDAPASNGGSPITDYVIEVDTSDGFDSVCGDGPEVQTLTMSLADPDHTGETFGLTVGSVTVYDCGTDEKAPWDIGVQDLQVALRGIGQGFNEIVVTRGGDGTSAAWAYGYTYSITFVHVETEPDLANIPPMKAVSCGSGADSVTYEVVTVRDGTGTEASGCQASNLLPRHSYSVSASDAVGAGDTALGDYGYLITGLAAGVSYRARVAAVSSTARSRWSFLGYPGRPATFSPTAVPRIVRNVTVTPGLTPGEMHVGVGLPVGAGVSGAEGLPLEGFRVEMARRIHDTQVVVLKLGLDATDSSVAYPTVGSYSLTVDGASTWCLDWDASAQDIELALDSLATVDGVSVQAATEFNSSSDATAYFERPMYVYFTGPDLSNGDQELMQVATTSCTDLDAGASVEVYDVTDGVAGVVSPSVTISTAGNDGGDPVSGSYLVSFGYRGDLGLRLGEGVLVTVVAGSRTIQCSADLSHYINKGDVVEVGGVQLVVAGDFSCEDTVASDNTVAEYPCSFAVESPHVSGAEDVPAFGASTTLGRVHVENVENADTTVRTDWDLTPYLSAGDMITIRYPTSGEYYQSAVSSVDASTVTLGADYEGPSAVGATAYMSPYAVVPFDASAEELRDAIESLPSVGSVEVSRKGPDEKLGFEWVVTLTSFNGPLDAPYTLSVSSSTVRALEVEADCGDNAAGTYFATGDMVDGRMSYKLVDGPMYIRFDSSEDSGVGRWVIAAEGADTPDVIEAADEAQDSLIPPTGTNAWKVGGTVDYDCYVSFPSSNPTELLVGTVSSAETRVGVEGSFNELAKDVSTQPGVSEVQQIQLGATSDALDGTFVVDFGDTGGFIAAWDISSSDMEVRKATTYTLPYLGCAEHSRQGQ